ncbi:hypothetical protein JANAI62_15490 [Jannaschia pagri]|uniref:DUF1150 domain-containing protein n=1 Tax=Jannaschia pagri TaxID=2829797 RepID=A0ABQ4NKI6_9RHOB|nr:MULTISPECIES: DUF1150 family protein [unclassified Jannaschia]GIT91094.1 hypothetical protein JANAI61_15520 [Jannaschia sp. AI_61]GIT94926.1 hypothetical protein JANAI62_15490 [Jannaschia sp. AI_62]
MIRAASDPTAKFPSLVYVRKVATEDLPERVQEEAELNDLDAIYAVCRPDGEQVALASDRRTAFALARENSLTPVSVH